MKQIQRKTKTPTFKSNMPTLKSNVPTFKSKMPTSKQTTIDPPKGDRSEGYFILKKEVK